MNKWNDFLTVSVTWIDFDLVNSKKITTKKRSNANNEGFVEKIRSLSVF
jgi:hypothetical protein